MTTSRALFGATATLLLGTILLARLTERRVPEDLVYPLSHIDFQLDGWTQLNDQQLDPQTLKTLDATSYLSRTFTKDGMELGVFVAFYAQQRAGESMHSPKNCLPGSGWEIWRQDSVVIPASSPPVRVNKYSIENLGNRMLMFYWYQSKDRIVASEYFGKILLARDALMTGQTAASIVRITLPDVPGAEQRCVAFAALLMHEVQRCFGGNRLL